MPDDALHDGKLIYKHDFAEGWVATILDDLRTRQQHPQGRFRRLLIRSSPNYRACFRVGFHEKQVRAGSSFEQLILYCLQRWADWLRVRSYTSRSKLLGQRRPKRSPALAQRRWRSERLQCSQLSLPKLRAHESYQRWNISNTRIQQSKIACAPRHTDFARPWTFALIRRSFGAWNRYTRSTSLNLGRWRWRALINWIVGV